MVLGWQGCPLTRKHGGRVDKGASTTVVGEIVSERKAFVNDFARGGVWVRAHSFAVLAREQGRREPTQFGVRERSEHEAEGREGWMRESAFAQ